MIWWLVFWRWRIIRFPSLFNLFKIIFASKVSWKFPNSLGWILIRSSSNKRLLIWEVVWLCLLSNDIQYKNLSNFVCYNCLIETVTYTIFKQLILKMRLGSSKRMLIQHKYWTKIVTPSSGLKWPRNYSWPLKKINKKQRK